MIALPSFAAEEVRRAFAKGATGAPRIGAEVELIAVDAESRRPVPFGGPGGVLELVRAAALAHGWREQPRPAYGAPAFDTNSGWISFEPGGQIEFSAAPGTSLSALVSVLQRAVTALADAADSAGIELLSVGVDPLTPVEATRLELDAHRYRAMQRHFDTIGCSGRRMMRQTASMQICVDVGDTPLARWRLLNALTPLLAAVFANSSLYDGATSGFQSFRRQIWASLDPARTGVAPPDTTTPDDYLEFALGAPAFLIADTARPARPAREALSDGAMSSEQWRAHLTTLFPEVRPRGYFEVRTVDALRPAWYAAPLVFLSGLVLDETNATLLATELPGASVEALVRAGRCGLADPSLAALGCQLAAMAVAGCRRLGERFVDGGTREQAEEFFTRYTARGLSPSFDASHIVPV